jgi:hypothetical protein
MTNSELEQRAYRLITAKIKHGQPVEMHWAVKELIDSYGPITGEGAEMAALCQNEHTYRVVKKVVDRYMEVSAKEGDEQLMLKGYEHVREAYTVHRGGAPILTPVDLMSAEEVRARIKELRKIARGADAHADELEVYLAKREGRLPTAI